MVIQCDGNNKLKRPLQWTEQPFKCKRKWDYGDQTWQQQPWNVHSISRPIRPCSERDWHPAVRRAYFFHLSKKKLILRSAISQNFTKCCPYHEKSRSNITKYCACNKKITLLSSFISCLLFSPLLRFLLFSLLLYCTLLDSTLLSTLLSLLCNALLKCSATRKFLHNTSFDNIFQYVWMLWKRSLPVHPFWVFLIISLNLTPPSSCKALYFCCSGARAAATASFMGSFRRTSQLSDCTWLHRGAHAPSSGAMTASKLNTHWKHPVQFTSFNHDHHQSLLVTCKCSESLDPKKSPRGPTERTPKPEYLIAVATYLGVRW